MNLDVKKCSLCQRILSLDAFGRDHRRLDGRRSECKSCQARQKVNYRARKKTGQIQQPGHLWKDILDLLRDGQWHTTQEIREIGGINSSSRLSDLRRLGYRIVRKRDYGALNGWQYRLVTSQGDPDLRAQNSPKERLLERLRDGLWHSNTELYELMNVTYQDHLYFLRQEGFIILKMKDPETGNWCYRLEDACRNSKQIK